MPHDNNQNPQPAPKSEENQLCTSCAAPNETAAHFCIKCGAPLSSYATTAPFESAFAEGFVYRQAAGQPRKLITVLGIWAIFGALAAVGVASLLSSCAIGFSEETVSGGFLLIISLLILWRTTMSYLGRRAGAAQRNS